LVRGSGQGSRRSGQCGQKRVGLNGKARKMPNGKARKMPTKDQEERASSLKAQIVQKVNAAAPSELAAARARVVELDRTSLARACRADAERRFQK
jgi:hypothetical protein